MKWKLYVASMYSTNSVHTKKSLYIYAIVPQHNAQRELRSSSQLKKFQQIAVKQLENTNVKHFTFSLCSTEIAKSQSTDIHLSTYSTIICSYKIAEFEYFLKIL